MTCGYTNIATGGTSPGTPEDSPRCLPAFGIVRAVLSAGRKDRVWRSSARRTTSRWRMTRSSHRTLREKSEATGGVLFHCPPLGHRYRRARFGRPGRRGHRRHDAGCGTVIFRTPVGERLFDWHAALFPAGRSGIRRIAVGDWRTTEQIPCRLFPLPWNARGFISKRPDVERLERVTGSFQEWFEGDGSVDLVLKTGVAHPWFVTLHPFEDGKGGAFPKPFDANRIRMRGLSRSTGKATRQRACDDGLACMVSRLTRPRDWRRWRSAAQRTARGGDMGQDEPAAFERTPAPAR